MTVIKCIRNHRISMKTKVVFILQEKNIVECESKWASNIYQGMLLLLTEVKIMRISNTKIKIEHKCFSN